MYFWAIYIAPFSFRHKAFNVVWLIPLFSFAMIGIVQSIRMKIRSSYILWTILLAFTIFHTLTIIDFDQRYRAPLLPIVSIYAGFGIALTHSVLLRILHRKSE